MPLNDTIRTTDGIRIYLWNPVETSQELLRILEKDTVCSDIILTDIKKYPEKRLCEILTVRILIKQVFGNTAQLAYLPNGAPYIKNFDGHISISHTKSCIALAIHKSEIIGIDVENKTEKIQRIQKKFINQQEAEQLSPENSITGLTFLWSAKESLYKAIQMPSIDFCRHLHVTPINPNATSGSVSAYQTRTQIPVHYRIHYRVYPDYILTAAIKNDNT